jgi:hypothetical protein
MIKSTITNKCASVAGHFDGHVDALKQWTAQCSISRAILDAPGSRHWATTHSVLPRWPPVQQANKQQSTNTPKKVAMFMAAVVHQYNTACIARWRRSRALLEATGGRHEMIIMSNNMKPDMAMMFFLCYHCQNCRKRSWVDAKAPVFNRGITYQTKEKGLAKGRI